VGAIGRTAPPSVAGLSDCDRHRRVDAVAAARSTRQALVVGEATRRHGVALAGFGAVVARVGDRWSAPTPCPEWDARALLEHVIGFHEVLVLAPSGVRAQRPKDDPVGRWTAAAAAIAAALDAHGTSTARVSALPGADDYDLPSLLPALTTDVLVHTWDLATAIDLDVALDPDLCERALTAVRRDPGALARSGMFAAPVPVAADAPLQVRVLAAYGRRA
jgi:uncharacterized protein (TIGR03086 family)